MNEPRIDPLDELLLPASDLAKRIQSGEVRSGDHKRLLAGALIVLLAERETTMWLLREERAAGAARESHQAKFIAELEAVIKPAVLAEIKGRTRLLDRDRRVATR